MATDQPLRGGSLIVAALIVLALVFAGHWIVTYVDGDSNPWAITPWYGAAAVAIIVCGFLINLRRTG